MYEKDDKVCLLFNDLAMHIWASTFSQLYVFKAFTVHCYRFKSYEDIFVSCSNVQLIY